MATAGVGLKNLALAVKDPAFLLLNLCSELFLQLPRLTPQALLTTRKL